MKDTGYSLVKEFNDDPKQFVRNGRGYALLNAYFKGYPITTLKPFLLSDDDEVREEAMGVLSELGAKGVVLIDVTVTLLKDENIRIKYDALESVLVCSEGEHSKEFIHVIRFMSDEERVLRVLATRLVSNATQEQIRAVLAQSKSIAQYGEIHRHGLSLMLSPDSLNEKQITDLIDSSHPLKRKYGAILAKLSFRKFPNLIEYSKSSNDSEISQFSKDFVDMTQIT